MSREVHVQFCERLRGKFPQPTLLIAAMKRLRFIPSTGSNDPFEYTISAEALLTQGFGMEQDYANLAVDVLARLGYQPKLRVVRLTEQGKAELAKMSGVTSIAIDELPAVSYVREDNTHHVLVMPFVQELSELKRLVYLDYEQDAERLPGKIRLEITAFGYLTEKGVKEQFSDFSDALGGDSGDTDRLVSKELYSDTIDLDLLSLDAIDIGIAKDGNKARIYMLRADGEIFGDEVVELDMLDVRQLQLRIDLPNQSGLIHTVRLDEGMAVDDVFLTVSINAPDIPREAALVLQEKAAAVHAMAENPSELSALRWYGRRIIYDFIAAQTERERTIGADLDLIAGRTQKPRVIVVTQKAGDTLQTSISLIETGNQIHAGKEEAIRTYNIVSGLYALTLEADVLPGAANGLAEIWSQAPAGTGLVLLDYIGEETCGDLEKIGLPEDLINYFIETSRMILIPENPSQIDGRLRWAWLEIDPDTHELYSVIDTLEKGAFVENTVVDIVKSAAQYAVGAFKGVETAIWSVAVFSLETDDYKEILKSARSLALGLADRFGFNYGPIEGGIGGKPSLSQAVGPVKFSFDGSAGMSQNVLSFTDGYKAGVAYYFSQAD